MRSILKQISNELSVNVTMIELKPIRMQGNTYVSGIKVDDRDNLYVHLKTPYKDKASKNLTPSSSLQEGFMEEPLESLWLNSLCLDKLFAMPLMVEFKAEFLNTKTLYLNTVSYREKGNSSPKTRYAIYASPHIAARDAMELKKTCDDLKVKTVLLSELNMEKKHEKTMEEIISEQIID